MRCRVTLEFDTLQDAVTAIHQIPSGSARHLEFKMVDGTVSLDELVDTLQSVEQESSDASVHPGDATSG